jgi:toxoflavin synthase
MTNGIDDQYEEIGQKYNDVKSNPIVKFVEVPSFISMLNELNGAKVLDLACGNGFYSRLIKDLGAESVTGADLSSTMITAAKYEEQMRPLGIDYLVMDATNMPVIGIFDIVTAVWLLHYAPTETSLQTMCRNIANNLKNGGRFVTIVPNPNFVTDRGDMEAYLFRTQTLNPGEDIQRVRLDFLQSDTFSIEYTQWPFNSYEKALRLAGFDFIKWVPMEIAEQGLIQMGKDFWAQFRNNRLGIGLTAVRSNG